MNILSQLLTPSVGIAISPLPIVGLILILLGNNAKTNSLFYLFGWLFGNIAGFVVALFFMGTVTNGGSETGVIQKIIMIILGLLSIIVSVRTFQKHAKVGEQPNTPKWFEKMTSLKPKGAVTFGLILSAANPKNLLLSISAGAAVSGVTNSIGENIIATIIFALLATSTIVIPTILFSIMGEKINKSLGEIKNWLIYNNNVITAVMFLFIGLKMLGRAF